MVINDTDLMNKIISKQIVQKEGITSYAHAPIAIEGKPIGILSAYSKTAKGIFTTEFIEMFHNLAAQIGVAWRNAAQTESLIVAREHERELDIAKKIQLSLLPTNIPDVPGYKTAGICIPAKQVGGDYYDLFLRSDQHLDAVIADVSGHDVGSALIMAETRTLIMASKGCLQTPAEQLFELNNFFTRISPGQNCLFPCSTSV